MGYFFNLRTKKSTPLIFIKQSYSALVIVQLKSQSAIKVQDKRKKVTDLFKRSLGISLNVCTLVLFITLWCLSQYHNNHQMPYK